MTSTVHGTRGEERSDYTRAESRAIRRRSLRLLGLVLQPLRAQVLLTITVLVVSTIFQVSGPLLIAYALDTALPRAVNYADWLPTVVIGALYLGFGIAGSVLIGWYVVLAARITQGVLLDLRIRIFEHTQRLSLEFHESYTSGRVISRQTSDLDAIKELLDGGLNNLVSGVLYAAFTLVALLILDWRSGLVLALAGIPLFLLMRWFYLSSQVIYRQSRVVSARVIVKFVETMTGIRAVQAFRKEQRNDESFSETAGEYRDVTLRSMRLFGSFDPGLMTVAAVAMGAVVLWGGFRVAEGAIGVGVLLSAVLYVRNFFAPTQEIAMFVNSYQSATAALEKVSGVLEEEPTVSEPERPLTADKVSGELRLDGVSFGYSADRIILPQMDLHIPAGQTIALVGATGAGKSTLAKLIARFYDPTTGQVLLDGTDLREFSSADLRRAMVMVTQEAYLFSGSVAENIALGKPDATFAQIQDAARAVGAHDFICRLPDGYETDVNKRGGRVSAGQRQLISFARAFLADPAVLILDEATASLDIPSERLIQNALQTLLADRTAIIIAHRLSTVAIADRVLVLDQGRVIEDGSPEALVGGNGVFSQMHLAWQESLA